MDEKDKLIQALTQELAKWKGRAIEAAQKACSLCQDMLVPLETDCKGCRMKEIQEGSNGKTS